MSQRIEKSAINALPLVHYDGDVRIVSTHDEAERAVEELLTERVLGFDTESRPAFRAGQSFPVAIVQLASRQRVYLFQVLQFGDANPLQPIFEAADILKVGVALHEDIRRLRSSHDFQARGFFELSRITQSELGIENTGLRALVAMLLGVRVSKGAQVSNWANPKLTDSQVRYAATDAWISRQLYIYLQGHGLLGDDGGASAIIEFNESKEKMSEVIAVLETNSGDIVLKLKPEVAPKTVENFVGLIEKGYYDGIIFHRVIKDFMVQCGDPTGTGRGGESLWGKPFADEFSRGESFDSKGILAMANAGPNTNGSQFFITTAETPWLDMKHTIFGEVIEGYETVAAIESCDTAAMDKPVEEKKIIRAYIRK